MPWTAAGIMVSAAVEAALHHHADDDGIEQREALAAASMVHSLTASRNLMAALSPLDPPPGFGEHTSDSGHADGPAPEDAGNCGAVSLPFFQLTAGADNDAEHCRINIEAATSLSAVLVPGSGGR